MATPMRKFSGSVKGHHFGLGTTLNVNDVGNHTYTTAELLSANVFKRSPSGADRTDVLPSTTTLTTLVSSTYSSSVITSGNHLTFLFWNPDTVNSVTISASGGNALTYIPPGGLVELYFMFTGTGNGQWLNPSHSLVGKLSLSALVTGKKLTDTAVTMTKAITVSSTLSEADAGLPHMCTWGASVSATLVITIPNAVTDALGWRIEVANSPVSGSKLRLTPGAGEIIIGLALNAGSTADKYYELASPAQGDFIEFTGNGGGLNIVGASCGTWTRQT